MVCNFRVAKVNLPKNNSNFSKQSASQFYCLRNDYIHRDLKISMVTDEIKRFAVKCERRPHKQQSNDVLQLLDSAELVRRLQRQEIVRTGVGQRNV